MSLPPYTVRVHPRARRVRIRVTALDGAVVTLPPRAPRSVAAEAIASRAQWVRDALERVALHRAALLAGGEALLPGDVRFAATGEAWTVRVTLRPGRALVREGAGTLQVSGATAEDALRALRRWLARAAAARLLPMLEAAAAEHAVAYSRATVRFARSRWGSFSAAGAVSLNRNLVFLPEEAAFGVVLHELAHARHHDHSRAFWLELERMDPDCQRSRRALKRASDAVPAWALQP